MIGTLRHKGLEELCRTGQTRRIGAVHFHSLQGKPKRWSVRVTGNYRITFGWQHKAALDVAFEDYH